MRDRRCIWFLCGGSGMMLGWILRSLAAANQAALWSAINIIRASPLSEESTSQFIWRGEKKVHIRKYEPSAKTHQSLAHLLVFQRFIWCAPVIVKVREETRRGKFQCQSVGRRLQADGWGGRLPDCGTKGVSRGWGEGAGGGGCALTARHMEGCRFPPDRESGILNAYLRCYRWRSQRQRILYKAFWKAPLIFHQNCVYTRKQTKKEVCRLNPPCSFSLTHAHTHTHTHTCSVLYFWSLFTHSSFLFTVSPPPAQPGTTFCSLAFCFALTFLLDVANRPWSRYQRRPMHALPTLTLERYLENIPRSRANQYFDTEKPLCVTWKVPLWCIFMSCSRQRC